MLNRSKNKKLNERKFSYIASNLDFKVDIYKKNIINNKFFHKISAYTIFYNKIKINTEICGEDLEKLRYLSVLMVPFSIIFSMLIAVAIILTRIPYVSSLLIIPIILYIYPLLLSEIKKTEYIKDLEGELLPFSILLYLNAIMGKGIVTVLYELRSSNLFNHFKREIELIERDSLVNGKSLTTSIKDRGRLLGNTLLSKVYTTISTSEFIGISLRERTKEIVEELSKSMKELYTDYVWRASEITEVIFTLFLLFPLATIGFQFLNKNNNSFIILLVPIIFAPLIILWISIVQPNMGYRIKLSTWQMGVMIGALAILLVPQLNLEVKVAIFVIIIQLNLLPQYLQIRNSDTIFKDFLTLLNIVSDYAKVGKGIRQSLFSLDPENFSKPMKSLLIELKGLIKESKPLFKAKTGNVLLNYLLGILDMLDKKGSDNTLVIQEVYNIISEMYESRRRLSIQLRSFSALAILTPLILWFATTSLASISSMSSNLINFLDLVYSFVIVSIYSKIYRFTLINPPIYIIVAVASLLLSILPPSIISLG